MGEVFRALDNELLEITLVEKLWKIMEIIYQEIFAEIGFDGKYSLTSWPKMKFTLKNILYSIRMRKMSK
jgi:hypothetical protein